MNKILLIGNTEPLLDVAYGQSAKVRLYKQKIVDEGFAIKFIELFHFVHHPLSVLKRIKKGIEECDRIVLLSAERGCKYLIPYINRINKKYKKPFVLPLIGTSVLHQSIDKLTDEQKNDFLVNGNYSLCKSNDKMAKQLQKITFILPETELLVKVYREFYHLNNVFQLNNFRDFKNVVCDKQDFSESEPLKLVFLSRVMEIKGIFDLLQVVKNLHEAGENVSLDIYGNKFLNKLEIEQFNLYMEYDFINYCGSIKNNDVICTISKYDLFVFPTRCVSEGTPGAVVEALISGTPVISSNFPQAKYLLSDGYDSLLYDLFDVCCLEEKIKLFCNNRKALLGFRDNAKKSGEKYTFESQRFIFLKYVCGLEEDKNNA